MAEHLRLGKVKPGYRVQGIGVGGGHAAEVGWRIAFDITELPHRGMQVFLDLGNITHLHPRYLGGDQRVAINVGISRDLSRLLSAWIVLSSSVCSTDDHCGTSNKCRQRQQFSSTYNLHWFDHFDLIAGTGEPDWRKFTSLKLGMRVAQWAFGHHRCNLNNSAHSAVLHHPFGMPLPTERA